MRTSITVLAALAVVTIGLHADNWPQFRGPNGQGVSAETGLPLKWSATGNIAWKTAIPGESWSSPAIWGDRVFLTTATDSGESCRVLSLDRKTGRILWDKEVFKQVQRRKEARNTYATPTPATDGERVYACFGDGGFAALNFAGDLLWTNHDYRFYGQHGLGTSAILNDGLLIMARDTAARVMTRRSVGRSHGTGPTSSRSTPRRGRNAGKPSGACPASPTAFQASGNPLPGPPS